MRTADHGLTTAGPEARSRLPWALLLFVTAAFFVMEHSVDAPKTFRFLMNAQSLGEFDDMSKMFEPSAWREMGGLALGLFGAAVFLRRRRSESYSLDVLGGLLLFFAGWCILSLLWTDEPNLSIRRLVHFLLLCLGAAGLANCLSPRELMTLAVLSSIIYLGVGIGAEISAQTLHPVEEGYRFAGTLHPNTQGVYCAIFFFAAVGLWKQAEGHGRWLVLLMLIALGFVVLTKSRTAVASVIAVMLAQYGLAQDRSRKVAFGSFALAIVVLLSLVGSYVFPRVPEVVSFGRTGERESVGTLTGRTSLWKQLAGFYEDRTVLGYGYGAFWNEARSWEVMDEQGWPISHAHNAFFDTLLESGPVGLAAYVLILILGIRRAFQYYRLSGNVGYWFFACVLLFCALDGVLESAPIQRGLLTFYAMVILVFLAFHAAPQPPGVTESSA